MDGEGLMGDMCGWVGSVRRGGGGGWAALMG